MGFPARPGRSAGTHSEVGRREGSRTPLPGVPAGGRAPGKVEHDKDKGRASLKEVGAAGAGCIKRRETSARIWPLSLTQ